MTNHGNRNKSNRANPLPADIVKTRADLGLTQDQSAKLLYTHCVTWQQWEYGTRRMHPAFWELFRIKTGIHPDYSRDKE